MIVIPFCNRCNTNLENHMKFCWNCGMPIHPQQVHGGGPPLHTQANVHSHGQYQETYTVSTGGQNPYQQSVSMTYGGSGMGHGPQPHTVVHETRTKVVLPCPFCDGEGTHPMNFDQPCPVCRGGGSFTVYQPYNGCQQCDGSGKKFATIDELCPTCRGRGVIQL